MFGLLGFLDTGQIGPKTTIDTSLKSNSNVLVFEFAILIFFFQKKLLHLNAKKQPIHMRYHLFLQYGSFRIMEKTSSELICT